MPRDRETESAWVTFSLLASLAIEELDIPPTPAPEALEFDPAWREQCAQMQVDSSETIPAGLDAVDACTRAWLHFLRRESLRSGSAAFQPRSAGGSFPDVWEASAAQCERSAQAEIQTRLAKDRRIPRQSIDDEKPTVARTACQEPAQLPVTDDTLNLLEKILEKRPTTLEKWAGEHKLGRTTVFDWKARRGAGKSFKGKVSDSKIAAIEKAIEDDGKALGLPTRTCSD
jgi:hypothetical protein